MPPAGIDMSAIQQALAARAAGGAPAGGTAPPAAAQQSQPFGAVQGGMPPTPQQQGGGVPQPAPGAPGAAQRPAAPKPNPTFDDETKNAGKVLITQLLKYL